MGKIFLILIIVALLVLGGLIWKARGRKSRKAAGSESTVKEQVYVGNLSYRVREDDLRNFFSKFGDIASLRIIRDHNTRRSKGFAFVNYFSSGHAQKALEANGQTLQGRAMVVRLAKPKPEGK